MRRSVLAPFTAGDAAGLGSGSPSIGRTTATVLSAALRALAAATAGFVLTTGLSLVLWALSPASGSDAGEAVQGGAVAFAAAHFLPVTISGTALTLRPLLLTGVVIAVMMTAVGHARSVRGRALEALHAGVFTVVYGLGVGALVAVAAPAGSARAQLLAPAAVAAVGAALSLAQGATDWRSWWAAAVPDWVRRSLRAAVTTMLALVSAAATVLAVAMAVSVPDALGVAQLTVHSVGDAIGIVLLGLAFLPNAVIAALGYVSGAGFSIGAAGFSPLAVHTADLPAVPLLAAVPGAQPGIGAWATLLAPVIAALIGAWTLRRVGASRAQRLAAVGLAALTMGGVTAALAAVGGGGVGGGAWAEMGADPLTVGGLIAGTVLVVTASLVVPSGWASLAWRVGRDGGSGAAAGAATLASRAAADGVESDSDAAGDAVMTQGETAGDAVTPEGETAGDAVISNAETNADDAAPHGAPTDDAGPSTDGTGAPTDDAEVPDDDPVHSEPAETAATPSAPHAPRDAPPDDPLTPAEAGASDPADAGESGGELQQAG